MSCPRCKSEDLFCFEVGQTPSPPDPESLPVVCRACGAIMVSGEAIDLPEVLAKPIRDLAESSAAYGKKAREELEELAQADPEARIEGYMANFYRAAYLDGFFRALLFLRHNAREGRVIRLRKLWEKGKKIGGSTESDGMLDGMMWPRDAYTEFEQLLHLSVVPGDPNAKSHENKRPPRRLSRPRVPR